MTLSKGQYLCVTTTYIHAIMETKKCVGKKEFLNSLLAQSTFDITINTVCYHIKE